MSANFLHLRPYDEQLFRLGSLAERYFPEDPNMALLKLRQLGELLAQQTASRFGRELRDEETQQLLLRRLEAEGCLDREIAKLFHVLRRKAAAHPAPSPVEAVPVPPGLLSTLLRECGSLSEKALLAASELEPARFRAQLAEERSRGSLRVTRDEDGQVLLEAVG